MIGRLRPGKMISPRRLTSITGAAVDVPAPEGLTHLQFRRFAGCPVCNLHLRSFVRRNADVAAAGVREVVFFHSSAEALLVHAADLPFDVVADPGKRLYGEFGVEAGLRALLDPRAWGPIVLAVREGLKTVADGAPAPGLNPEGGRYGLPADFLVSPDGRLFAAKYGDHADDQWSVDELFELAATWAPASHSA